MRHFAEIGLLILYGFTVLMFVQPDILFVISFLLTLSFNCLCYFWSENRFTRILAYVYAGGSFLFPSLLFYFPAAAYSMLYYQCYTAFGLSALSLVYFQLLKNSVFWPILSYYFFGILFAVLLQRRNREYENVSALYIRTRNDDQERNLLLQERNRSLLDKQDYEIYTATLKERNRIAREIHDNVGHTLSRSILMVGAIKAVNPSPTLSESLNALDLSLNQAMDNIRQSVHDLHDDAVDLKEALQTLIRDFHFCPVELNYGMGLELPTEIKYCFIGIAKEALSNVMKHSNASKVYLSCQEHPALYQLCISDNGTASPPKEHGIGLTNMRERTEKLGGNFQISTGHGYRIFVTIPRNFSGKDGEKE